MKQTVKKVVAALFATVLVAALVACGGGKDMSNSKYLGTWELTKGSMSGMSVSAATLGISMKFTLKADGKFDFESDGETDSGSWDETENGISFKSGGETFKFVEKGETLELDYEGVTLIFERK